MKAMALLKHRGPDDEGYCYRRVQAQTPCILHLAHTRLSILDLTEAGRQPMTSPCKRYTVVFNGEIFNYRELRDELKAKGHYFATDTDTEVLLAAWAQWGEKSVPRFVGMFAFALFDGVTSELNCVRDAFGIKPFFYAHQPGIGFHFASEIEALLVLRGGQTKISTQRVHDYLLHGLQDAGSGTFVEGVHHLRPAHVMCLDLETLLVKHERPWWEPNISERHRLSFSDAAAQLRELFMKNVALHLRSDVPVGAALSGGIDSSAIVCAMRQVEPDLPIHTFSYIPSDPRLSEEHWINIINTHVSATQHLVRYNDDELFEDLPKLIRTQGEPFNSTSMYAQYRIFKAAKTAEIPVILEGQGADELLGGYLGYPGQRMRSLLERGQWPALLNFAHGWSNNATRGTKSPWRSMVGQLLPEAWHARAYRNSLSTGVRSLLSPDWIQSQGIIEATPEMGRRWRGYGRRLVEALANSLTDSALPTLLRFGDRNAMRFSVENRVPFLTTELADFMLGLPERYLVSSEGETKHLFRSAMRGIVPNSILDRPDKVGFATPLSHWLVRYAPRLEGELQRSFLLPFGDASAFIREWNACPELHTENEYIYWRLINLALWLSPSERH